MALPTPPTPEPDDIARELVVLQERISALVDTTEVSQRMGDTLGYLYDTGANADALQAVADDATELIHTVHNLDTALKTAANIAKQIQRQREEYRQALAELKTAIQDCDTDHPDVGALYESIELDLVESDWYAEIMDETIVENIVAGSGLKYDEAWNLLNLLGGWHHVSAAMWDELRGWITRAYGERVDHGEQ